MNAIETVKSILAEKVDVNSLKEEDSLTHLFLINYFELYQMSRCIGCPESFRDPSR